ncbi:MAG: lipopolysaccharide assembly protein LapA domain-containing protein [bacterium]|nr:lipopolysaccharide assembly protein LapA domain-containing protein [bacterium]
MKFLKSIGTALLFLLAITFSLKNNEMVSIKYYFQLESLDLPLYLLVFFSVILGIFIGGMEGVIERIKSGNVIRKLKKEMKKMEEELTSLRNLPLTETRDSALIESNQESRAGVESKAAGNK